MILAVPTLTRHLKILHSILPLQAKFNHHWAKSILQQQKCTFWAGGLGYYRAFRTQLRPPQICYINFWHYFRHNFLWGCILTFPPTSIFIETLSPGDSQPRLESASPSREIWLNPA